MKRAIIHGCYHTTNFGDLLLLDLISDRLLKTYGVRSVSPWVAPSAADVLHAEAGRGLRDCFGGCAAIMGGGGYLHNGGGAVATRRLLRYVAPSLAWRATGVPYVVIGTGAGPKLTGTGARRVRRLCNGARAVCVRDVESREVLVRAGVPASAIEVTADLVLGMRREEIPADDVAAARATIGPRRENVRRLGLHLQVAPDRAEQLERLFRTIGPILRDRDDIDPVFIFDHGRALMDVIERLAQDHLPRLRILDLLSHWPTAALLGEIDGLITTKLHTGITAWTLGVPPCGYSSHPKTTRLYAQLGRQAFQAPLGSNDRLVGEWVECFADDPAAFGAEGPGVRETLPRLARRNYEVIETHLGDRLRRAAAAG